MGCHSWFYKEIPLPTEKELKKEINRIANKKQRDLKLDLDKLSFDEAMDLYEGLADEILEYYKGKLYSTSNELPHDLFRVSNYPDDILTSLEETLAFINNPKNECRVNDLQAIHQFWIDYPNGLITFG